MKSCQHPQDVNQSIFISEASHQGEGVLRLDVQVVEPPMTYSAIAVVTPNGDIHVVGKSRHLPPEEKIKKAVREYLASPLHKNIRR